MTKIPFTKIYKQPAELLHLLQSRHLNIPDPARAERYIQNIGYYRLSAYMYPFLSAPKSAHIFKSGTTFNQILRLYRFDKKLRVLLFNEIEKIEIAVREAIMNMTSYITGDIFWLTTPKTFSRSEYIQQQQELAK